jgi:hypothetical protein
MKPGTGALLFQAYPRPHAVAVRVRAVAVSGVQIEKCVCSCGAILRPGVWRNRRAFLPLAALENLTTATDEKSAAHKTAGAVAVCSLPNPELTGAPRPV